MAQTRLCSIEGCGKRHYGRGFCEPHYHQRWSRGDFDAVKRKLTNTKEALAWIDAHLDYSGEECLTYPFNTSDRGYANVSGHPSGTRHVSRIMCEHRNGPPTGEKPFALHSCGNGHRGCVNQKHLRWGSYQDNANDMVAHGTDCRGEKGAHAKLAEEDVLFIRASSLLQRELAEMFGVRSTAISKIVRRERWKHI